MDSGAAYYDNNEGRATLTRITLDLATGASTARRLARRALEFPVVAPSVVGKPHHHTYLTGARFDGDAWGPPQVLVKSSLGPDEALGPAGPAKARLTVCDFGRRRFAQEPIFVPREGAVAEDDGWLLALVFDAATDLSELVIVDAQTMARVATVRLPLLVPAGLHGFWTPEYLGLKPGALAGPIKYDIRRGGPLKYE
jgi:all-trans-8'-apo-beta-carotenal 15,15'-oxygenase